jgi:hypothetical protein
LENVLARKQLQQAEYDLRQTLIYETPKELGAMWDEFQAERSKLLADKARFDIAQKKRMSRMLETGKNNLMSCITELLSVRQSLQYC